MTKEASNGGLYLGSKTKNLAFSHFTEFSSFGDNSLNKKEKSKLYRNEMTLNLKKQNINFDNPNLDDVQTNQKYFIDVCAGAGGLSLGFMIQKFKPMLLNDVDKNCVETLKLNHPYTNIYHGKMKRLI